ncbi:MAG: hypothetical protein COA45_01100 [Zetaproteobacteria bacterium]|nr:MAG: hypothetical protein COA45_01100 [Zetaproteobacteria bacterium]
MYTKLGFYIMIQKLLSSFLCSLVLIGMTLPLPARADVKDYEQEEGTLTNLISRNGYEVSFFNTPHLSDNTFTMRIYTPGSISGCARTTGTYVELDTAGDTLKIEVVESEVLLNDKKPLYAHNECTITANQSFFDVLLDRNKLMKSKIEHISIRSREYGDFQTVDVKIKKDTIRLTSTMPREEYNITFWFLPKNTITLQAPNAKNRDDVRDAIRKFGIENGLTPIEDVVKSYEFAHDAHNYLLFEDTEGRFTKELGSLDDRVPVGKITLTKTRYGANGSFEEQYDLKVIAKRTKNTYNNEYIKRLR